MYVFHHCDDDGRSAAAIVKSELTVVFDQPSPDRFIEYAHTGVLPCPEDVKENETIYIVDLALDNVIFGLIKELVTKYNCNVIHIDHHITTFDTLTGLSNEDKQIMDRVTKFYKEGISGSLLTWIYACMNEDERTKCNEVPFDFSDGRTHVAFNYETPDIREYRIPTVIRFIDDNDVWSHEIDETKYFTLAFQMEADKNPCNELWHDLIYGSDARVYEYVNKGKILWSYQEGINEKMLKNAFECEIDGHKCLCLNTPYGNSRVFNEKFDEYPMVCKFHYTGEMWKHSFYSSEKHPDSVDVSIIAKKFGGGGHRSAAGVTLPYNIFEHSICDFYER